MPPARDAGRPVLGHHHLDRAGDDDVGRAPVGLDQALGEQAARTAATVPGDPCSRNRRRQGNGHRALAGCAAWGGYAGQQVREHADGEPDQLLGRQRGRVHGGRAEPGRRVGPGERDVDPPAAGRGGREHLVDQARATGPPGGQVEPAYQLEVDGVGERGAGAADVAVQAGSRSSQADQVVVPPARRCAAQPATASS